jgi:tRNA-dihydrouridine synthase B
MAAPMAGVSDLPFRLIVRRFGAPFAFTEMIDARALSHGDRRTVHMLSSSREDRPLGVQLVGNDEKYILKAIEMLEPYDFDLLDLNAACPAPKLAKKGMGAGLLREPAKLEALLRTMAARSKVPVTVKIRSGWDDSSLNAREVSLRAEDAGVSALFIHGRTKIQGYSGSVNLGVIKEVKEALSIPVIASGDNMSVESVRKMFDETNCDGVAIARGSLGNPWIFRDLAGFWAGEFFPKMIDAGDVVRVMKDHLEMVISHYGERRGVSCFRKFFIWYTRGIAGARPFRDRAFRAAMRDELLEVIEEIEGLPAGSYKKPL